MQFIKKLSLFFLTLCTLISVQPKMHAIEPYELAQTVGKVAGSIGLAVLANNACTLTHELGHAVAGKVLYGYPINITLFDNGRKKPLLDLGSIKLQSLNFIAYSYNYINFSDSKPSIKKAIIMAAGPAAGLIAGLSLKYASQSGYLSSDLAGMLADVGHMNVVWSFLNLIPGKLGPLNLLESDGYKLAYNLGISPNKLDYISKYYSIIIQAAQAGLIVYKVARLLHAIHKLKKRNAFKE